MTEDSKSTRVQWPKVFVVLILWAFVGFLFQQDLFDLYNDEYISLSLILLTAGVLTLAVVFGVSLDLRVKIGAQPTPDDKAHRQFWRGCVIGGVIILLVGIVLLTPLVRKAQSHEQMELELWSTKSQVTILAARRYLSAGETINLTNTGRMGWVKSGLPPGAIEITRAESAIGKTLLVDVEKEGPILSTYLSRTAE